ncbi:MAG: hypothetical protein EPN64_04535 [Burkholderiaceae bacterium]|nr:MAG: hypothetical protein EPN64_04535 [Burkholderiaceae bacterium]
MKYSFSKIRPYILAMFVGYSMWSPTPSYAFDVVIDPWNLVQSTTSAAQAVLIEINSVKQYQQMLQANMAGMSGQQFTNAMVQLGQLNSLYQSARNLQQSIGAGASAVGNIQALYGASNYPSFHAFETSLAQRKAIGDADATNLLNAASNATSEIQSSEEAHQQVVNAMSGVAGPTEAAQVTAAAVGTVVEQNQAFLGTISAMAQDQGVQRAKASKDEADTEAMESNLAQQNAAALAALQANPTLN